MTSNIEDLFGQIVSSEQEARKRKSQINEVKTKLQKYDSDIHKLEADIDRLQGQLVLKAQQYNDLRLQVDWEQNQQKILHSQKSDVMNKFTELEAQFNDLESEVQKCQQEFIGTSRTFCAHHNLGNDGRAARRAEWETEISDMQAREKQLKQELSSYQQHQTDLDILSTQTAEQTATNDLSMTQIQELKASLEVEKAETLRLTDRKQAVADAPQQDPEYIKLQKDLSGFKASTMENVCLSLEQELQALQRHQWQQQIQRRADKRQSRGAARPNIQRPVRPLIQQAVRPQPVTSTAVVLTNYDRSRVLANSVTMTTVTKTRSQPWVNDDEPIAADVASADHNQSNLKTNLPNIAKISSAVKQQRGNTGRFLFRRKYTDQDRTSNENSNNNPANQISASSTNPVSMQQSDEPITKKQRQYEFEL